MSLTVTEADGDTDTETKTNYITVFYTERPILVQQTISPAAAATVKIEDERIVVEFPAGAVVNDAVVTIREEPQAGISACPSGFKAGATCFSIELIGEIVAGTTVTITIKYCQADIEACGGDSNLLRLSRYDGAAGEWVVLPTTVDTVAQTLTGTTDHLSKWTVLVEEAPGKGWPVWIWVVIGMAGVLVIGVVLL